MPASSNPKIRVGVVGAAGYAAGELLRLLVVHPAVEIIFAQSTSQAGKPLYRVHEGLMGLTDMTFSGDCPLEDIDTLFLCGGHGNSRDFWASHNRPEGMKVIDFAQDYRDESDGYVYGLPEVNRERIAAARLVANPGCFATSIQLGLLPAVSAGLCRGREIHVTAMTGSTGAGQKPSATTHFSWRDSNASIYKPLTHQHLAEIRSTLASQDHGNVPDITFVPVRGPWTRGIFAIIDFVFDAGACGDLGELYSDYYAAEPFVFVDNECPIDLKEAVNTNMAIINAAEPVKGHAVVTVAIDNLLKGAAGQAVQNFNIMHDLDERMGLRLKASGF